MGQTVLLRPVDNQGGRCGSCWAFAATHTFSDNRNIHPIFDRIKHTFSAQDVLKCTCQYMDKHNYLFACEQRISLKTGQFESTPGCARGTLESAFDYMNKVGVVSTTCKPQYDFKIGQSVAVLREQDRPCRKTYHPVSRLNYTAEQVRGRLPVFGQIGYNPDNVNWKELTELIRQYVDYGPVAAGMWIYPDFFKYEKGIYVKSNSPANRVTVPSGHAVEIVGYGRDEAFDTDYWIVKNSWGIDWPLHAQGKDRGFFKIRAGTNEVGIESNVYVVNVGQAAKRKKRNAPTPAPLPTFGPDANSTVPQNHFVASAPVAVPTICAHVGVAEVKQFLDSKVT